MDHRINVEVNGCDSKQNLEE